MGAAAAIYLAFNLGSAAAEGWGMAMSAGPTSSTGAATSRSADARGATTARRPDFAPCRPSQTA
jgi:hypothetical protein